MIVGWADKVPQILALGSDGNQVHALDVGFCTIGSGALFATAAYNTILIAGERLPMHLRVDVEAGEKAMNLIMEGAIETAPNCGRPAYCWRVTTEGLTPVFELSGPLSKPELGNDGL